MGMLGLNHINAVLVGTSDPIFRDNFLLASQREKLYTIITRKKFTYQVDMSEQ